MHDALRCPCVCAKCVVCSDVMLVMLPLPLRARRGSQAYESAMASHSHRGKSGRDDAADDASSSAAGAYKRQRTVDGAEAGVGLDGVGVHGVAPPVAAAHGDAASHARSAAPLSAPSAAAAGAPQHAPVSWQGTPHSDVPVVVPGAAASGSMQVQTEEEEVVSTDPAALWPLPPHLLASSVAAAPQTALTHDQALSDLLNAWYWSGFYAGRFSAVR